MSKMVKWNKLSEGDKKHIKTVMMELIEKQGLLCQEVFNCKNLNCKNAAHLESIDKLFEKAKTILSESANEFSFVKYNKFRVIPGWNDYVKDLF